MSRNSERDISKIDADALVGAAEAKWRDLKSTLDWERIMLGMPDCRLDRL